MLAEARVAESEEVGEVEGAGPGVARGGAIAVEAEAEDGVGRDEGGGDQRAGGAGDLDLTDLVGGPGGGDGDEGGSDVRGDAGGRISGLDGSNEGDVARGGTRAARRLGDVGEDVSRAGTVVVRGDPEGLGVEAAERRAVDGVRDDDGADGRVEDAGVSAPEGELEFGAGLEHGAFC